MVTLEDTKRQLVDTYAIIKDNELHISGLESDKCSLQDDMEKRQDILPIEKDALAMSALESEKFSLQDTSNAGNKIIIALKGTTDLQLKDIRMLEDRLKQVERDHSDVLSLKQIQIEAACREVCV